MKTSELTGPALDWTVAKAEGWTLHEMRIGDEKKLLFERTDLTGIFRKDIWELLYSTDWSQGGPIIEREFIWLEGDYNEWNARIHDNGGRFFVEGPTPLIAAMRCFVASKLGDEVDVPEELL